MNTLYRASIQCVSAARGCEAEAKKNVHTFQKPRVPASKGFPVGVLNGVLPVGSRAVANIGGRKNTWAKIGSYGSLRIRCA